MIGKIHKELCLEMYRFISELRPSVSSSAAGRAATMMAMINGLYVVSIGSSILHSSDMHLMKIFLPIIFVTAMIYIYYVEKLIIKCSDFFIKGSITDGKMYVVHRARWRLVTAIYSIFGFLAPFVAGIIAFCSHRGA
jgi:hypothetical protein